MVQINLEKQVAIVTGAGRGLGKAISRKLAEAGASVMVSDLILENAEEVAAEIKEKGGTAKAFQIDVTDKAAMDAMIDGVVAEYGKLDVMVNNAGYNVIKLFADSDISEFNKLVDINLKGVYHGCHAAVRHMIKQREGKIVNTSSQAGKAPFDYHSMYSATKFGVIGMSQVLAKELGKYNINVNCICPGIVRTEMWEQNLREYDGYDNSVDPETRWGRVVSNIPMKRPQEPEDMANAVLFLCSDLARNISGQAININGGQVCV